MRKVQKLLLVLLLGLFFMPLAADSVLAQTMKIGYVQDERIQQEYKGFVKSNEQWETEKKAWEDEAVAKQQELEELFAEYEKQKLILSDDKKREKEAALRAKEEALDAFTRQIYGPGGTAERKHQQLLQPLLDLINKAIEAVATEGNYDIIFGTSQSGIAFIKPDYDVTEEVLKKLEEGVE